MLARHGAAAQAGEADRAPLARPRVAVASRAFRCEEVYPAPFRRRFAEQQRGAGGRVHLRPVVHLEDFDVPVRPQPRGRLLHQMREQGDAERGIAGLQHGDRQSRRVDRCVVPLLEPGRADENGDTCPDGRIEIALERRWGGKVHQRIASVGEPGHVAAAVHAARVLVSGRFDGAGERVPHAPFAADDADARHCSTP